MTLLSDIIDTNNIIHAVVGIFCYNNKYHVFVVLPCISIQLVFFLEMAETLGGHNN